MACNNTVRYLSHLEISVRLGIHILFKLFGNSWEFIGIVGLFHLWMTPLVNLIKWNNYPNIDLLETNRKVKFQEKNNSELTWLVLYSPYPCSDPLLVIYVFLPSPPKYTPQKLTAFEPENTPQKEKEKRRLKPPIFGGSSRWIFGGVRCTPLSSIHATHLLSKLQHEGCILRQLEWCLKKRTPLWWLHMRCF